MGSPVIPAGFEVEPQQSAGASVPDGWEIEPQPVKLSAQLPQPHQADAQATANAHAIITAQQPGAPTWPTRLLGLLTGNLPLAAAPSVVPALKNAIAEGPIGRSVEQTFPPGSPVRAVTGTPSMTPAGRAADPMAGSAILPLEANMRPGAARGAAEFAAGLTTPENITVLAATGGVGALEGVLGKGLLRKLVSAGFSGQMLKDAYQQFPQLKQAWDQKDWPHVRQFLTRIVLTGGMAGLAGKHALERAPQTEAAPKPAPEEEYTITGRPVNPAPKEQPHATQPAPGASPAETKPQSGSPARPVAAASPEPSRPVAGPAADAHAGANGAPPPPADVAPPPDTASTDTIAPPGEKAGPEYFRGAWNVQMNDDGRAHVAEQAAHTAGQFSRIYSGTKDRHTETAGLYAQFNPQAGEVRADAAFDPMSMGEHEGEQVTPERLGRVNDHVLNHATEPLPGTGKFSGTPGEAPGAWMARLIGATREAIASWKPGEKHLVVTSGRDMQAIRAWAAKGMPADGSVDPTVLTARWETQPGEMARLDPRTGKIDNVSAADADGIYFVRHGETDGNANAAVPREVAQLAQQGSIQKSASGSTIGTEANSGGPAADRNAAPRVGAAAGLPETGVDAGAARPVDAGAAREGRAVHGTDAAVTGRPSGENTDIAIPGEDRSIRARYEVWELGDLKPSHNGQTFLANDRYGLKNERDYSKAENQQRVIGQSSEDRFNPRYHITDNPDATNGPPLINEDGDVVAGNSRAMGMQRVYGREAGAAAAYRALLEKRAAQYGIDPEQLRNMKQPVLVRVASNEEFRSLPGGSAWAVRKTNVSGTAALSASERAAADAGQLAPELVQHIAGAIEDAGADATLNDALTGKSGTAIVNRLIAEGFFSEQERPALMDGKTGALTQLAKDRISKAMLGQFFRDSDQIARTPAFIKAKLERIAAPLSKVQGNPEWDLAPAFREAVDLLEYAGAHGIKNLGDVVAQESMFGEGQQWHSDAVRLAELLRDAKPNDLVSAVRKYVNDREPSMFGEVAPAEAFRAHFGGEKAERPAERKPPEGPPPAAPSGSGTGPKAPASGTTIDAATGPEGRGGAVLPPAGAAPETRIAPEGGAVNPREDPKGDSALKQFWAEEKGTSLAGSILHADWKEAAALKAKRDAAMEALEKSKATPKQTKFGRKVIEYFTGERDLWGARVNQVIERLRKLVPDPVEQEGLSLMRDFKRNPQELTQFLDGTHPAFGELGLDPETGQYGIDRAKLVATAHRRIEQLRPAILRALDPTPRMIEADKVLTTIADGTLREGQRLGFLDSRWTPEEYNPHILHPKGEGEVPTAPAGDRIGRALGGKMGRYFAFAEKREFPTLLDAVINNYVPKTLNAFDAFTIHGDKFATARATHLLTGELGKAGLGKWGVQERAPEGWVALAPHSTEFRNLVGYEDEQGLPAAAEQRLFVPQYISDALRPITDPDYLGRIPLFRAIRHTQAYQKAVQLGLSFFHAYTENLMSLANSGPTGWVKALRADRDSPQFLNAERDMVAHGGTTAVQGKTVEAYRSLQPGSIPTWGEIWQRAPVIHQVDTVAGKITDFTFGNLQRRFKVTDYQLHLASWMADHPRATPAELSAAKVSMAKEINAVYGGLNSETLGANRSTVEILRALMLAPDWTFSNIFNLKYALERGTPAGSMARRFWIRAIGGGLAATQAMSLLMSGKPSKQLTQVYFGKDSEGNDIYQNVFFKGASGDVVNLVHNVGDYGAVQGLARSMAGKAAPLVRTGIQTATNRDYLGREIVPKGMNPLAGTVRAGLKTAESLAPVPFTVQNVYGMLLGPEAGKYSVPEFLTTAFSGNPPRHVPPEGMRRDAEGDLVPQTGRPEASILEQIRTGRTREMSEEAERTRLGHELTKSLRAGKGMPAEVAEARKEGRLSRAEVTDAVRRSKLTPLQESFEHLQFDAAVKVYGGVEAGQRPQLRAMLLKKGQAAMKQFPGRRRGILDELRGAMGQVAK